jgi:GTPase
MGDLIDLFGGASTDEQNVAPNSLHHSRSKPNAATKEQMSVCHDLPPEPQTGNVEYKLMLDTSNAERLQHLTTQMKWRLKEGQGTAFYEIGVGDDGRLIGLSDLQLQKSLCTLKKMADQLDATISVSRERRVTNDHQLEAENVKMACRVMICRKVNSASQIELRVAVLGTLTDNVAIDTAIHFKFMCA